MGRGLAAPMAPSAGSALFKRMNAGIVQVPDHVADGAPHQKHVRGALAVLWSRLSTDQKAMWETTAATMAEKAAAAAPPTKPRLNGLQVYLRDKSVNAAGAADGYRSDVGRRLTEASLRRAAEASGCSHCRTRVGKGKVYSIEEMGGVTPCSDSADDEKNWCWCV